MPQARSVIEFERRQYRMADLPDDIAIETVMGCNLRCPMCPISVGPDAMNGRPARVMTLDVYRRILEQIADRRRFILLTIIGEPLLHPRIVEFVALAKGDGHRVGLITNGTRLHRPMAIRLIEAGLDVLTMSVDGFRKETFESVRIGARHDVVFGNLRDLISENASRGHPLRIEINYVVSSRTAPECDRFFAEFSPLVARINFNPIADFGGQFVPPEELLPATGDPRMLLRRSATAPRLPCIHLWRQMFVSVEGRLMLCCNDIKLESALPSVTERPLRDIWRDEMEQHRRNHVEGAFDREPCRSCRINSVAFLMPAEEKRRILQNQRRRRLKRAILPTRLLSKHRRERRRLEDRPIGFLDLPAEGATLHGFVAVVGWAIGCRPGRDIRHVSVRVDGAEVGTAHWGFYRPDVGEMNPGEGRSFSGFEYMLDTRCLSNAAHVLEISVTDTASQTADFGTRSITVQN